MSTVSTRTRVRGGHVSEAVCNGAGRSRRPLAVPVELPPHLSSGPLWTRVRVKHGHLRHRFTSVINSELHPRHTLHLFHRGFSCPAAALRWGYTEPYSNAPPQESTVIATISGWLQIHGSLFCTGDRYSPKDQLFTPTSRHCGSLRTLGSAYLLI